MERARTRTFTTEAHEPALPPQDSATIEASMETRKVTIEEVVKMRGISTDDPFVANRWEKILSEEWVKWDLDHLVWDEGANIEYFLNPDWR